jgi:hypothetical protein
MLRWEMGDEHFFNGLNNYLNDPSVANGFASQKKFVKHMEMASDTTFTEFFKDWYYGEGYPVYRMNYFPDPANPTRQILRISQIPSQPSAGFFEIHLPVRVWKDGKYKDFRLYNTRQNQEFIISEAKIDSIQFDPQKWLCAKVDMALPVHEVSKSGQIQVIPEYSSKRIRVILPELYGIEIFRILDLNGRTVLTGLLAKADSWINMKNLKNGIYLVEVKSKERKVVKKIIVGN